MSRIVKKLHKEIKKVADSKKKCIICKKPATHRIRGHITSTYCRDCAKEHFKFLHYLDKL